MAKEQTRTTLATRYKVCRQTISKLLADRCGITHRNKLTIQEVELFERNVGTPEQLEQVIDAINR
ncbi:MAG: hypothetical protein KF763_00870 [Cyclobacteriaceae bacterium]|nr:hypothetical protein [Cyclobacteriaceae bacterium]